MVTFELMGITSKAGTLWGSMVTRELLGVVW